MLKAWRLLLRDCGTTRCWLGGNDFDATVVILLLHDNGFDMLKFGQYTFGVILVRHVEGNIFEVTVVSTYGKGLEIILVT